MRCADCGGAVTADEYLRAARLLKVLPLTNHIHTPNAALPLTPHTYQFSSHFLSLSLLAPRALRALLSLLLCSLVESGLAKLLVAQVREAKHVKQEARLVHVPELLLRPGKPRKALLGRLGVRLVKARHLAFRGIDVLFAPIRFVVGKVDPVADDAASGPVVALESNQRRNQPTLTRLMKYFFKWHASS